MKVLWLHIHWGAPKKATTAIMYHWLCVQD